MPDNKPIEFDTETTGLQWPYHKSFMYQFYDGELLEALDPKKDRARIQWWFDRAQDERIRAWNSRFDLHFATNDGFKLPTPDKWHDGLLLAHAINENRSVALKSVATEVLGPGADDLQKQVKDWLTAERRRRKTEATNNGVELVEPNYSDVPYELMKDYALEDVILTRKICDIYDPIIQRTEDYRNIVEFERQVMAALFDVERLGFPVDEHGYRMLELEIISRLEELETRLDALARIGVEPEDLDTFEFNPKSSKQILAALKRRKADLTFVTDGSMDAENLSTVEDELAREILNFRAEFKALSTYVRPYIQRSYESSIRSYKEPFICPDGRIHASYRQVGAKTGRMSATDPSIQTQPRDDLRLRYNFRAEPGMKLVSCDLSNIELRIFAAYAGEGRLLQTIKDGGDVHELTADLIGIRDRVRPGGYVESARQRGKTFNFCVPYETEILTKRGWLKHDEVSEGDLTLGYNPETGLSEWTPVTKVHHFNDAPITKMENSYFSVRTTPNHRWYGHKRRDGGSRGRYLEERFFTTEEINSTYTIKMAAPSEGGNHPLSARDAAIIAWLHTDGRVVRTSKSTKGPSQGINQTKMGFTAFIYQKKEEQLGQIRTLLADVPHSEYEPREEDGLITFYLNAQWARDLWDRAGLDKHSLTELVANLSLEALTAFLGVCYAAEGWLNCDNVKMMAQNEGDVLDAMQLAVYLIGHRPSLSSNGTYKGKTNWNVRFCKPHMTGQRLKKTNDGVEPVWCVETGLGTWTMRQGKAVCLTGNSKVYGGGIRTIRKQLRCTQDEARMYNQRYSDAYPEIIRLTNRIEWRLHDTGYIKSAWGRHFRVDPKYAYRGANYLVQGTAADVLKEALIKLHKDGVPIVGLVHDEVVSHCDEKDAKDVKQHIIEALTDHPRITEKVPLEADGVIVDRWSDAKPLKDDKGRKYLFVPEWDKSDDYTPTYVE